MFSSGTCYLLSSVTCGMQFWLFAWNLITSTLYHYAKDRPACRNYTGHRAKTTYVTYQSLYSTERTWGILMWWCWGCYWETNCLNGGLKWLYALYSVYYNNSLSNKHSKYVMNFKTNSFFFSVFVTVPPGKWWLHLMLAYCYKNILHIVMFNLNGVTPLWLMCLVLLTLTDVFGVTHFDWCVLCYSLWLMCFGVTHFEWCVWCYSLWLM